ncbi:hypothetical protein THMIRHAS_16730 [Thiosulfatimonas sediminis]|uniref:Uncharacterized protein n=1 Tax=Thiosulfatimonas sediminis TaxID=2675054 RepID=A0A6F8PWF2_9GAMM|nr:hypothetical protein [Thiosulfatimonas sediminis]BBP46300.1 hypothetical protein THMIRHAS_16730 [Thiosulfatimonas sediminis]
MNENQAKYIAETAKLIAIAQFGYFGYKSLETPDHALFYVSCGVFIMLTIIGTVVLGLVKKEVK